ncbi:MAG: molybdopterin-dependent oxidoreductase [Novosphingobium sp.]|nr:molybdopterin-dependent oxidoreductase [Novosphingobium sp.]MCP5403479.1 molybdopterin-dependent oxidoreductase [Novosphingobium sp.]
MNAEVPGIGAAARYIGKRVLRKEDPRLLTGRGQFVDDISLPGMLHCAFARSPIARGRIVSIDSTAARDVPGVHAVYTAEDLAKVSFTMHTFFMVPTSVKTPTLAEDHVAYVGEPVALVIADSRYIAEDAASLIEVDYEEEDPVVTLADAKSGQPVHPELEHNIAGQMGDEDIDEDLEAAIEGAPHRVTQRVIHPRISQSPMETRGVVATRDGPEELTLYITCQSPHTIARWVSLALGLPQTAIRVIAKDVGGAFGLKNHPWKEESSVIIAAMLFGRPLKWIEDRYENLTTANPAREQDITLRIAFDNDGKLVASHSEYDLNNGAYPQAVDDGMAAQMFLWSAYKLPAYGFLTRAWYTNTTGLAAYRGPWAMETLVRETALDKAARAIGIDPVELRRRNLVKLSDQPTASVLGLPLEDITPAECLEKLVENFDIAAFRKEQAEAREQGRYLGLGVATYIEPTASAGSMGVMTGELAQVRIEPTGKVTATMSTHSQGHGTATTMAQVIADRLGVPYEDVTVFEGDNSRGGFGPGAAGSRQGVIAGGAAIKASEMLADKVKALAAHLLNANPENITIDEGMVHVEGAEEMSRSLSEIAGIAYGEPDRLPQDLGTGLEVQYRYQPPPMTFTSAAHACVVEVDAETGFVKILRWISSEDCGTVINPAVVEGQISGGLAQGIGMVLLEEMPIDDRGNTTAATYKDYLLPAISDIPDFEFLHANTPSKSIGGMRGVGEGGAIIGPPTLVNAIADALSPFGEIDILELPLTPSRILDLIEGRDISGSAARHQAQAGAQLEAPAAAEAAAPAGQAAAPSSGAETRIDGDWKMVMKTPMGDQEMTGHFETDGGTVSGYLASPEGDQNFTGTVDGNVVKFDLKVDKPMKITLKYNLTFEGDSVSGKVKLGMMGSAKLSGERL